MQLKVVPRLMPPRKLHPKTMMMESVMTTTTILNQIYLIRKSRLVIVKRRLKRTQQMTKRKIGAWMTTGVT